MNSNAVNPLPSSIHWSSVLRSLIDQLKHERRAPGDLRGRMVDLAFRIIVLPLLIGIVPAQVVSKPLKWAGSNGILTSTKARFEDRLWSAARNVFNHREDLGILSVSLLPPLYMGMLYLLLTDFSFILALIYLTLLMGPNMRVFLASIAVRHHFGHNLGTYVRPSFRKFSRFYFEWILGTLHGFVPGSWTIVHPHLHHAHFESAEDLQNPTRAPRDSLMAFRDFALGPNLVYLTTLPAIRHYWRIGHYNRMLSLVAGVVFYLAIGVFLLWIDWRVWLLASVMPFFLNVIVGAIVSWVQHGFWEPSQSGSQDLNTVTILSPPVFMAENHHFAHHVKPTIHWSRTALLFASQWNQPQYQSLNVFRDIEYMSLFLLMVSGRVDLIAHFMLSTHDPDDDDGKINRIRTRLRAVSQRA